MAYMEMSEKVQVRKPRVVHGPHRLRVSGVAPRSSAPVGEEMPTVSAGEPEIVTTPVEISVELIPLDEPK